MATPEETKAELKKLFNEVLDERETAREAARKKKEEDDLKANPPKKGFLDGLLGA